MANPNILKKCAWTPNSSHFGSEMKKISMSKLTFLVQLDVPPTVKATTIVLTSTNAKTIRNPRAAASQCDVRFQCLKLFLAKYLIWIGCFDFLPDILWQSVRHIRNSHTLFATFCTGGINAHSIFAFFLQTFTF